MRRFLIALLSCGCGDAPPDELDAREVDAQAGDAQPHDGDPPVDAPPAECIVGAAPMSPPTAGTYCTTWTRIDGLDAFPRYYDRAEVTLSGVTWRTEGGKEYVSSASLQSGCLRVAGFTANGGQMSSDPIVLCWSDASRSCGLMTWYQPPPGEDGHWAVQLDACQ